jgi:hypothetical protein
MIQYNSYQQMHYKTKFGGFIKKAPENWDLIYLGQYIVKNAAYAICKKAKQELEKNRFTIKSKIIFERAK